ncbi:carboxypeptidase M32 [Halosimplex aquaticum]
MATESSEVPEAYEEFEAHVEQLTYLSDAGSVLGWDQQVTMPEGGTPARSKQSSALSAVTHERLTDDRVGEWLDELDDADLDAGRAAVVREIRREHERAVEVPEELVSEISETSSNALPVWEEARAEDDFDAFAPTLEKMIDLKREYAEAIDPDRDPYEVLFEEYEPYLGLDTAERVLERLRDELVPLIDEIEDSDAALADPFAEGEYDPEAQEETVRAALDTLGYNWDRGRLDTAAHPFSTGTQFDARVTTRFDPEDPMGAIGSTIHEFGHATYTLGLPDEHYGTPLGQSRDLSVHESQSRLWENHVGRSRPFWDLFADTVNEKGVDASPREYYEAANQIYPDNLIRVEADELTYHMHIILRFEIERDLIAGDLDVEEVPQVWNDKMEEYLGVRPETDSEGCLQDIHWTHGSLGYFPTYSLGSVMAAQLYASAEDEIADLGGKVRAGEFDPLHEWLTENVHRHGCRYETDDLVREATGESFTADYFLDYANEKFGALYDL